MLTDTELLAEITRLRVNMLILLGRVGSREKCGVCGRDVWRLWVLSDADWIDDDGEAHVCKREAK